MLVVVVCLVVTATTFTRNTPSGNRLIRTRVILCPRTSFTRLPFTNTLTRVTRPPRGWWILKVKRRGSTQWRFGGSLIGGGVVTAGGRGVSWSTGVASAGLKRPPQGGSGAGALGPPGVTSCWEG